MSRNVSSIRPRTVARWLSALVGLLPRLEDQSPGTDLGFLLQRPRIRPDPVGFGVRLRDDALGLLPREREDAVRLHPHVGLDALGLDLGVAEQPAHLMVERLNQPGHSVRGAVVRISGGRGRRVAARASSRSRFVSRSSDVVSLSRASRLSTSVATRLQVARRPDRARIRAGPCRTRRGQTCVLRSRLCSSSSPLRREIQARRWPSDLTSCRCTGRRRHAAHRRFLGAHRRPTGVTLPRPKVGISGRPRPIGT